MLCCRSTARQTCHILLPGRPPGPLLPHPSRPIQSYAYLSAPPMYLIVPRPGTGSHANPFLLTERQCKPSLHTEEQLRRDALRLRRRQRAANIGALPSHTTCPRTKGGRGRGAARCGAVRWVPQGNIGTHALPPEDRAPFTPLPPPPPPPERSPVEHPVPGGGHVEEFGGFEHGSCRASPTSIRRAGSGDERTGLDRRLRRGVRARTAPKRLEVRAMAVAPRPEARPQAVQGPAGSAPPTHGTGQSCPRTTGQSRHGRRQSS